MKKRGRSNYFFSSISIVLLLLVLGLTALLMMHSSSLVTFLKENVSILVEIKPEASPEEVKNLQEKLIKMPFIIPGSVEFHTKGEALASLVADFGGEFSALDMTNPLFDVLTFNVWSSFMESDSLNKLSEVILQQTVVRDVFYQEGLVVELSKNIEKIAIWGGVISLIFLFIAFILINNTIRLALFSNRFLIKNMELVGATWGFITRPYVMRSILQGFLSSLLAIAGIWALLSAARQNIPEIEQLVDQNSLFLLFLGVILVGVLLTAFSTYTAVKKFLHMKLEDLY